MVKQSISYKFNIMLLLYCTLKIIIEIMLDPNFEDDALVDSYLNAHPTILITLAIIVSVLYPFGAAKLAQEFWNRLINDIFQLRLLTFSEALSITLIVGAIV